MLSINEDVSFVRNTQNASCALCPGHVLHSYCRAHRDICVLQPSLLSQSGVFGPVLGWFFLNVEDYWTAYAFLFRDCKAAMLLGTA